MPYRIDSRVQNTHLGQHGYSGATAAVADAVIQEWHDNDSAFTSVERLYSMLRNKGFSRGRIQTAADTLVLDGWLQVSQ